MGVDQREKNTREREERQGFIFLPVISVKVEILLLARKSNIIEYILRQAEMCPQMQSFLSSAYEQASHNYILLLLCS